MLIVAAFTFGRQLLSKKSKNVVIKHKETLEIQNNLGFWQKAKLSFVKNPHKKQLMAIGMVTGLLSGLLGVGGGILMVPALAFTLNMEHHLVIGTSLAAMLIPSIIAIGSHAK